MSTALAPTKDELAELRRAAAPALLYLGGLVGPAVMTAAVRETLLARFEDAAGRHGATPADLSAACRRLADPDVLGRIRRPADLLAEFSAGLGVAITRRRAKEQADARRRQDERDAAIFKSQRAKVLELLAGIGTAVGRGRKHRPQPRGGRHGDRDQAEEEARGQTAGEEGGQAGG